MARNKLTEFLEYNHREELVASVAQILASNLHASIQDRKNVIFSVPGGNTPGPIFDKLCDFDLDWKKVSIILNDDGRPDKPLVEKDEFKTGKYEIVFFVGDYFKKITNKDNLNFLDDIVIRFGIADNKEHFHVPLLVSPWSYSTYRGS